MADLHETFVSFNDNIKLSEKRKKATHKIEQMVKTEKNIGSNFQKLSGCLKLASRFKTRCKTIFQKLKSYSYLWNQFSR